MRIENLATLPTAERLVTRIVKGFPRGSWEKEPGRRNEALDCRVYARARRVIHGGYMARYDMATIAELEARLEALKAQRDSTVARVSYDGRMAEYRGTVEISSAIAELERELQALQGKAAVRQIRVYTSKGY